MERGARCGRQHCAWGARGARRPAGPAPDASAAPSWPAVRRRLSGDGHPRLGRPARRWGRPTSAERAGPRLTLRAHRARGRSPLRRRAQVALVPSVGLPGAGVATRHALLPPRLAPMRTPGSTSTEHRDVGYPSGQS